MEDDDLVTAHHEAGHAVAAYALGGLVDRLSLFGEEDEFLPQRFGDCRIYWGVLQPKLNDHVYREVMTVLAGPAAEMIYTGRRPHPSSYPPWVADWQMAMGLLRQTRIRAVDHQSFAEMALKHLHQLLGEEPCWPAIQELATQLEAHEELEGEEISEVLRIWMG